MTAKTISTTLPPASFQMVWFFDKFHMILFLMLDTFYMSSFLPKYYFNKLCFQLPQNVTWTDE